MNLNNNTNKKYETTVNHLDEKSLDFQNVDYYKLLLDSLNEDSYFLKLSNLDFLVLTKCLVYNDENKLNPSLLGLLVFGNQEEFIEAFENVFYVFYDFIDQKVVETKTSLMDYFIILTKDFDQSLQLLEYDEEKQMVLNSVFNYLLLIIFCKIDLFDEQSIFETTFTSKEITIRYLKAKDNENATLSHLFEPFLIQNVEKTISDIDVYLQSIGLLKLEITSCDDIETLKVFL